MAYIGKSPTGAGVRSRFFYTQSSAGSTSISGNDDDNRTLTFSDAEYVDVYLNGSLLAKGDYTAASNTISGLAALASGDIVEVVVYDIFSVADTVSAKDGGTFSGNVGMQGLTATTGDFTGQLHVQTSAVNSSIDNVADEFVIENNGASGMTILSANNDSGFILFGDDSDNAAGGIRYENATSAMSFRVNSGWDKLRIDSAGRVTMPNQPMFTVSGNPSYNNAPGASQVITFNSTQLNQGNHWNTNTFTAPIAGNYGFLFSAMSSAASHTSNIAILKNGTPIHNSYVDNASYLRHNINVIMPLAANDTVQLRNEHGALHGGWDMFSGFLIG